MRRLLVLFVVLATSVVVKAEIPEELSKASVLVRTEKGTGSGVVFNNGDYSFVWTNAHVAETLQSVKTVIDPKTGQPSVQITHNHLIVSQEMYEDGRKVGEVHHLAEVLRLGSPKKGDYDLSLLRVFKKKAYP